MDQIAGHLAGRRPPAEDLVDPEIGGHRRVEPRSADDEERAYPLLSSSEINGAIRAGLNRKMVVLGACIGTDAHTVGIDAILNVKGFAGEKGLEYLREMAVTNLGAQVTVPELVAKARTARAEPERSASAARVLETPETVVEATATLVVPPPTS